MGRLPHAVLDARPHRPPRLRARSPASLRRAAGMLSSVSSTTSSKCSSMLSPLPSSAGTPSSRTRRVSQKLPRSDRRVSARR